MRFKIDLARLIVVRKFTLFALFYFVFEGNFQKQGPPLGGGGAYIWRGDLTEGFLLYQFGGLIFEVLRYLNFKATIIGLISKKATLHVQDTFFIHFFTVVLHNYNVRLPELPPEVTRFI